MRRGVCEILCGDLDELEQPTEGDPDELEQQAEGDPDELEQQAEGDPDELEQQAEGDPDELEQQAEGDPDELEQQAEGDPDELEQQAEINTNDRVQIDSSNHASVKNGVGVGHGDIGGSYNVEADITNGNTQLSHTNGRNYDSSERDQYYDFEE